MIQPRNKSSRKQTHTIINQFRWVRHKQNQNVGKQSLLLQYINLAKTTLLLKLTQNIMKPTNSLNHTGIDVKDKPTTIVRKPNNLDLSKVVAVEVQLPPTKLNAKTT